MGLSRKATNTGKKMVMNAGRASRNFAIATFASLGRPIEVGDTVKRKTDGEEFLVTDVKPYGLILEGQTGFFNAAGFVIVTPHKHR